MTAHGPGTMLRQLWTDMQSDEALRGLVLMNAAVVLGALITGDGAIMLMFPYWTQSVVIGLFNVRRIAVLKVFRTDGLKINGVLVGPTPSVRRQTWVFFLIHYGLFHLVYLMFMGAFGVMARSGGMFSGFGSASGFSGLWLVVMAAGYVITEWREHAENRAEDEASPPNLGTLMFSPYARIVPMHLTIIFGALLGGRGALVLFGALKTAVEVFVYRAQHRAARSRGTPAV
jgi:hypothetical protein